MATHADARLRLPGWFFLVLIGLVAALYLGREVLIPLALATNAMEVIGKLGISVLSLLAAAVAVVVLTALMLVQRDDLRDRLIRLVGEAHIHITTQAMEDAGHRVSRYLMMQLVVNACYG